MITIICVGKIKEKYLKEMIDDYQNRINKYHKLSIIEIKDTNINNESLELLKYIKNDSYNIVLDIGGIEYDSISFAKKVDNLFINYSNITFIIGGSNGINYNVKEKCHERISFSKFTFPHGLFRAILLEQIYRCFKINNNEAYHK